MRRFSSTDADFDARLAALLAFESAQDPQVDATVSAILADVKTRGDAAVLEYTQRFDRLSAKTLGELEIPKRELDAALKALPAAQRDALAAAAERVREFHEKQSIKTNAYVDSDGNELGQQVTPLDRAGIYVPGGKAAYPSTVIMKATPAKVAGVETVVACTPPVKGAGYYPATINAMKAAGADRIFVVGGVPAMALMAFGMGAVEPVDILCGAGNKFVAEAKRQLFGQCGIDLLAGPTEIAIIADETADPALVACDLLGQAEHDPNSGQLCVCLSEAFARETLREVEKQLATCSVFI